MEEKVGVALGSLGDQGRFVLVLGVCVFTWFLLTKKCRFHMFQPIRGLEIIAHCVVRWKIPIQGKADTGEEEGLSASEALYRLQELWQERYFLHFYWRDGGGDAALHQGPIGRCSGGKVTSLLVLDSGVCGEFPAQSVNTGDSF